MKDLEAANLHEDLFPTNFVDLDTSSGAIRDWDNMDWIDNENRGRDLALRSFAEQEIGAP